MKTNITSHPGPRPRAFFTSLLTFAALTALLAAPAVVRAQTFYVSSQPHGGGIGYIDKVDSTGAVSLFATLPGGSNPYGLAFDTSGNLYVADSNLDQISIITPGGTVSTFAFMPASSGATGLAFDGSGNLYVADQSSDQISMITPGGAVSLFATLPAGSFPAGLAFDTSGNLYAADQHTDQISKITPGGAVSLFATLPGGSSPRGLVFDNSGILYVAENGSDQISAITGAGVVSTFATLPGGSAPVGLAIDRSGNLYAADNVTDEISIISPSGAVSTLATGTTLPRFIALTKDTAAVVKTGDSAVGVSGAKFTSFGNPAMNSAGHTAFSATVTGSIKGIWADDAAGLRHLVVRQSAVAPGAGSAVFSKFADPVYNSNEAVAFNGTLKTGVGGVIASPASTANNIGVWSTDGGSLHFVARRGAQAPGCPTGATFGSFTQIALPDQAGVVLLATLNTGAGGVTTSNNIGIWAVDTGGTLQFIVRKGDTLPATGKMVTTLSFLPIASGVSGQTRGFSQGTGDLLYKATFADGSTAILKVVFP